MEKIGLELMGQKGILSLIPLILFIGITPALSFPENSLLPDWIKTKT